ncbi:MAG: hypothetical protein ACYSU5_12430 [Planctomycetota bacterium]
MATRNHEDIARTVGACIIYQRYIRQRQVKFGHPMSWETTFILEAKEAS